MDACAPCVTKQIKRPFSPWMSFCLREAMNLRDDTKKKLKSDRYNTALQEQYKHEKERVKTLIPECKVTYNGKKCLDNKGNISKTWATIKEIVPACKNHSREYNFDDESKKANEFNVHFANVGRNL